MSPSEQVLREWQVRRGLRLSWLSLSWGLVSGCAAIAVGITSQSLGVLGVGLNVLADAAGSAALAWRFRVEVQDPVGHHRAESIAALVVAAALTAVAAVLTVDAIAALVSGSRPEASALALAAAAANLVVLAPLGIAKRSAGAALPSRALVGDATLSLIGAALAGVALLGLLLDRALGWWWADRAAALIAAGIAAFEAVRILRERRRA